MTWTRYNHLLPPGSKSCANGLTWDGVAMTANSRHAKVVGLLLGDGSVRLVKYSVQSRGSGARSGPSRAAKSSQATPFEQIRRPGRCRGCSTFLTPP